MLSALQWKRREELWVLHPLLLLKKLSFLWRNHPLPLSLGAPSFSSGLHCTRRAHSGLLSLSFNLFLALFLPSHKVSKLHRDKPTVCYRIKRACSRLNKANTEKSRAGHE
jgi:hypothetical protein